MTIPLGALPTNIQLACVELRDFLCSILGDELLAIWVYGAVTFTDRPSKLGDIDMHAIIKSPLKSQTVQEIDRYYESANQENNVEWDAWFILERDVASHSPPPHAFRDNLQDRAWALHRAHWLGDQYVALFGPAPSDLVKIPKWAELKEGLHNELLFIEGVLENGLPDPAHAAFVVWQGCRIIYSLRTNDIVVSKRAAAKWALSQLPISFHESIRAAERVYDGLFEQKDQEILQNFVDQIVAAVQREFE